VYAPHFPLKWMQENVPNPIAQLQLLEIWHQVSECICVFERACVCISVCVCVCVCAKHSPDLLLEIWHQVMCLSERALSERALSERACVCISVCVCETLP